MKLFYILPPPPPQHKFCLQFVDATQENVTIIVKVTKNVNTQLENNMEFLNIKRYVMCCNNWSLTG